MVDGRDQHTAADSAMGYLYQCRFALLAALRESKTRPNIEISVERFDDIAFDENDDPRTLIQTKHQVRKNGDLGDLSADLWKTISIWAKQTRADPHFPFRVRLFLLTTGIAADGTAACLLRQSNRNETLAQELLLAAIERSRAQKPRTLEFFATFQDLSSEQQNALLRAITILDGSPNLLEVEDEIANELIRSTTRERVAHFVERLEGWWFGRVVQALVVGQVSIPASALENKIDEIRDSLTERSLPVDFHSAQPPAEIIDACDQRPFVQQLRLINIRKRRIEIAVRDYYRASEQRSRWAREELLVDDELGGYDRRLCEAWEPRFYRMQDEISDVCDETDKITAGEKLYLWAETEADFPLRTVHHRFLSHGSFHILSNRCQIGWHPDFTKRVRPAADDND